MASTQKKIKGYIEDIKKEKTPEEKKIEAAFNKASKLYSALKDLETETHGDIKILSEKIDFLGRVAIETNIPGSWPHEHLTLFVTKFPTAFAPSYYISDMLSSRDSSHLHTFSAQDPFSVKKAVKYVLRQAKANKMI